MIGQTEIDALIDYPEDYVPEETRAKEGRHTEEKDTLKKMAYHEFKKRNSSYVPFLRNLRVMFDLLYGFSQAVSQPKSPTKTDP